MADSCLAELTPCFTIVVLTPAAITFVCLQIMMIAIILMMIMLIMIMMISQLLFLPGVDFCCGRNEGGLRHIATSQ